MTNHIIPILERTNKQVVQEGHKAGLVTYCHEETNHHMNPKQHGHVEVGTRDHVEGDPVLILELLQNEGPREHTPIRIVIVDVRIAKKKVIDSHHPTQHTPQSQGPLVQREHAQHILHHLHQVYGVELRVAVGGMRIHGRRRYTGEGRRLLWHKERD
jgi:hypothetical protein